MDNLIQWKFLLHDIRVLAQTEMGRLVATLIALFITILLVKLIQRQARVKTGSILEISRRRSNFVLLKNLVLLAALIVISTIWASKIAGAALSLAAVAGAMLIVSKEFLSNLLGTAFLTVSRLYRIGDFIELDGISGRVIDTDLLSTTLSETQEGSQLTSRTVTLPHSLMLTKPVRNLTATGMYVVHLLKVVAEPSEDLIALEAALLKAAFDICAPWLSEADAHLQRIESRDLVDLPSAEPKVILQLNNVREATLSLRYTCRPNERVKVEQAILRHYLAQRTASRPAALLAAEQDRLDGV